MSLTSPPHSGLPSPSLPSQTSVLEPLPPVFKKEESPQSILKSSANIGAKRRNPDNEFDTNAETPPTKRLKVEFSHDVEVHTMDINGSKSHSLVSEEVLHALKKRETGNRETYDDIISMFSSELGSEDAPTDDLLSKYLIGLTNNVSMLKKHCSDLVHAALQTQWLGRDSLFASIYIRFLGHLLTSHFGYTASALKVLVDNFAHITTSAGPSYLPQDRPKLLSWVHSALRNILILLPSSTPTLRGILSSTFPFPTDSKKAHTEYVKNLLLVIGYAPELKSDILDLITDRLIKIDVEVQINVEDLDEEIGDILIQGQELEDQSTLTDDPGDDRSDVESLASDESIIPKEQRLKDLKGAIEKMDAIIDMLFSYYSTALVVGHNSHGMKSRVVEPRVSLVETEATFNQLLVQFSKNILPTYRSRHTQFLLFHFAQSSKIYTKRFVDLCLSILQDKARTSNLRLSAAAYVASFVARGAHLGADTITSVFDSLASYLERLRSEYEPSCRGPDPRKYSAYYATAQALIYIFCFRWKDLLSNPEDKEADDDDLLFGGKPLAWALGIRETFQKNFFSKLNPLKVCSPEIVDEFARLARQLRFLYIYQILEANKRIRLSQGSSLKTAQRETCLSQLSGERHQQLELFFPFDPYQLPLSRKWVLKDYNEWKGAPESDGLVNQIHHDSSDDDEVEIGVPVECVVGPQKYSGSQREEANARRTLLRSNA